MRLAVESVDGLISREFDRIYTQGTPYEERDPIGTLETVNAMTADDLRAFYEKWYVPANMAVVVVGDMDVEDQRALVEEHFGPLPASEGRRAPSVYIPSGRVLEPCGDRPEAGRLLHLAGHTHRSP